MGLRKKQSPDGLTKPQRLNHPSIALLLPMKTSLITRSVCLSFAIAVSFFAVAGASADQLVADFGNGGWYSWDTRGTAGSTLNGSTDTSPSITPTLLGRPVPPASPADDILIEQQIIFMDEGQTVNDV